MPKAKEVEAWPHQDETIVALDDMVRFIAMLCGTGAGKTWWSPWWLAELIGRDVAAGDGQDAKYIVLARTYRMLQDTLVPLFRGHYKGTVLEGHYRASQEIYELPTGGLIYFRSADKPFRIEGIHARGAILDEPSEMPALIWIIIQARTGLYEAPILFTGYPTNMGWYHSSIYQPWVNGDSMYRCIIAPSTANPQYTDEEMQRARGTMPDWMWRMRYLGEFARPMGLVYPDFGDPMFVEPFDIPDDWPSYVTVDPGVFYGALFTAWHDGVFYSYGDYYVQHTRSASDHAKDLLSILRGTCQGWLYDPARLTDVVNLEAHGCGPFYKASNPVMPGIETTTGIIKSGRWKILRGTCPHLVDQMGRYSFKTDPVSGAIDSPLPIKKDDHLPDCARYLFHTLEGLPLESRERMVTGPPPEISEY